MMPIKILIADDHRLFRQGLISLMKTRQDIVEVIGEAEDGQEAIEMARALHPDLILLDIYMPTVDGLKAASVIRTEQPQIAIVIMTQSVSDEHLFEAVRLGVSGYLPKNMDACELFHMLCGVTHGEAAVTRDILGRILRGESDKKTASASLRDKLTEREIEVVLLVAEGMHNGEIARSLDISRNTVKTHLRSILYKLNLDNRIQLAAYAVQNK